jgi:hypothetical protein
MSCSLACTGQSQEVNYTQCGGGGWGKVLSQTPNPNVYALNHPHYYTHSHSARALFLDTIRAFVRIDDTK